MKSGFSTFRVVMMSLALLAVPVGLSGQQKPASPNPVPLIDQPLVPDAVAPGGSGFTLTVNGTGFVTGSTVNWNGSPLATTFVSNSQLTASVPATDVATANTASVTVVNPAPGGGISNVVFIAVSTPAPSLLLVRSNVNTGSNPQTLATGDFNGDGKVDLVVPNYASNTVSVLLGKGDGTFAPRVDYATGTNPVGVAVGDFNRDGNLDLAVANVFDNTVSILLGNGDGTFRAHVDYGTGVGPGLFAVGDFNGDGNLDLAVTCNDDMSVYTVSVLLGNADGTFQQHVDYPTGSWPSGVVVGDFNQDGKLDLVVSNAHSDTISVLLGIGDGTFEPKVDYPTSHNPRAMATADFNGDGNLDLAVASQFNNSVSILLGDGNGGFQPPVDYGTGQDPVWVALGDFNGDGNLDLAVTNFNDSTVNVLLGNGDGTFQPKMNCIAGANPNAVAVGDFNEDGRLDLAVVNNSDSTVSILLQATTVSFSPQSLTFGNQVIGTQSPAQNITFTNSGAILLTISSIAITGSDKDDFIQQNNCGQSLAPRASCTIGVVFTPTQVAQRAAAVTITDNGVGSPQSIPLSGTGLGLGPNATFSPTSLTFATQVVNTTSPSQPVTLTNYGSQTLNIAGGTISGDFSQTDNCGSNLAPGASCTFNVTFAPLQRGNRSGTLSVKDNAPNGLQIVRLTGVGTVVELEPSILNFGTVILGQSSQPQNTTLTNVGIAALQITSITITGSDPNDFSQINTCDGGVGAGQSCTITVTFTPTQVGLRTADVSVSDNGGGSPQQVSLSGTGQALLRCGSPCSPFHNECPQTCHFCRFDGMRGDICSTTPGPTSQLLNESFLERNQEVAAGCAK